MYVLSRINKAWNYLYSSTAECIDAIVLITVEHLDYVCATEDREGDVVDVCIMCF